MPLLYEERTLNELKDLALSKGFKGVYKMNKNDIISLLRGNRKLKIKSPQRSKTKRQKYEKCVKSLKKKYPKDNRAYPICMKSIYK